MIASEIILNKFISIFFLFFCLNIAAQDSIAVPEITIDSVKTAPKFKETDILIDSSQVESRSFSPNLKEKYNSDEFIYEQKLREKAFADFQVNEELMDLAHPDCLFMHCLPAHRGEEVAAEVIDGPKSVIWREAYHRRTTIQAVLYHLVRGELAGN